MLSLEKDLYDSNTLQMELVEQHKMMERVLAEANDKLQAFKHENEILKQHQPIYIGKVSDDIDVALQNFLNDDKCYDRKKLKILFIRESMGIYRFG